MKKLFITLVAGAMTLGSMAFSSCAGQKNGSEAAEQEAAAETLAEETTDATTENLDQLTDAQKTALIDSKLVTDADFSKTIFIDFNATWCGPCRQFAPYFEAAAEKYAGKAVFIAVDVDQYGDVANAFGVQSIPMMIGLMPNGKYVTYIGTQELVGDGAFDKIVETYMR